jgi:hypothetical protein
MIAALARLTLVALPLFLLASACEDSNPTDPSPPAVPSTTDTFSSTLAPGASSFYSFPTFIDGTARVMLASVTEGTGTSGAALSPTLTLGLGIPQGIDCTTFVTVQAAPGLAPQIDGYGLVPGTYCVRIADTGGALTATSSFLIRMTYPNPPRILETPDKNEQFDTTLAVGGSSARTILATKPGNVQIRLQSLGNGVSRVGLGFGVPRLDGTCAFTRSTETGPGGNFTIGVVAGQYCLRVYDVGTLTTPTGFNVALIYP